MKIPVKPHFSIRAAMLENVPSDMCMKGRLIRVWSEVSSSAWEIFAFLDIQIAPSEVSHRTVWLRRLIWIFVGRTCSKVRYLTLWLICSYYLLTLVMLNKLRCYAFFKFSANQITWFRWLISFHILNGKQCRSRSVGFLEANWSGSTLFAKAVYIRAQQDKG